jgi:transcriptional regulator with XRE-family HTH domain
MSRRTLPRCAPGRYIFVLRKTARLTLQQLSDKTGISRTHLSAMERNQRTLQEGLVNMIEAACAEGLQ